MTVRNLCVFVRPQHAVLLPAGDELDGGLHDLPYGGVGGGEAAVELLGLVVKQQ